MKLTQIASIALLAASINTAAAPAQAIINDCETNPIVCNDYSQRQGTWNPDEAPEGDVSTQGRFLSSEFTPPEDDGAPEHTVGTIRFSFVPPADDGMPCQGRHAPSACPGTIR